MQNEILKLNSRIIVKNHLTLSRFQKQLVNEKIDEIEVIGEASLEKIKSEDKLGRLDIKATINTKNGTRKTRNNKRSKGRSRRTSIIYNIK